MRCFGLCALLALWLPAASDRSAPAGSKTIKDSKVACQIWVPEDWTSSAVNSGSAFFQDPSTAIAVVTSQPGQTFKPLTESLQKLLRIPKERMFENSAVRIFYQDRIPRDAADSSAFTAMVPGKGCTCSSRVVFLSSVSEETAKKITLSVGPAPG